MQLKKNYEKILLLINNSRILNWYIPLCLLLMILFFFFKAILMGPLSTYAILDNYITFLAQFDMYWLQQDTLLGKLKYFITVSNWPHPKIISRALSVLSYYTLGHVHFGVITLLSNIGLLVTVYVIYQNYFKKNIIFIVPVAALLLQVIAINFWTVAIVAHGFVYLFVLFFFISVVKQHYFASIVLLFVLIFRSGGGFLVIIPLFIVLTILYFRKQLDLKFVITLAAVAAVFFLLFYLVTLNGSFSNQRTEVLLQQPTNIIKKISSIFVYGTQVLGGIFNSDYLFKIKSTLITFFLGLIGFLFFTYQSLRVTKQPIMVYPLLASAAYFMLLCFLAGLVNDSPDEYFESTISRYNHFSLFFWISIYILVFYLYQGKQILKLLVLPVVVLTCLSFADTTVFQSKYMKNLKKTRAISLFNNISGDYYSKPNTMADLKRKVFLNIIYTEAYKKSTIQQFNFDALLTKKATDFDNENTITINDDNQVDYHLFQKNGLTKLVGRANFKLDSLYIKFLFKDGQEQSYIITNVKRKKTDYFFNSYFEKLEDIESITFFHKNDDNKIIELNNKVNFNVCLIKDNFINSYNFRDINKINRIEKRFLALFDEVSLEKMGQRVNNLQRERLKQLTKYKKKK